MTATTVAMSLVAFTTTVGAFTSPPTSAVRLPQHHLQTQLSYQDSAIGMPADSGNRSNDHMPIRTNQLLTRLTQEQEVSLLKQMRSHPSHSTIYQMARETLMLHNLPLVQSIVTKITKSRPQLRQSVKGSGNGKSSYGKEVRQQHLLSLTSKSISRAESQVGAALTQEDLLHEGTIGLAEAIDRYDLAYAYEASDSPLLPKGARLGTYATYWIRARIVRAIQSREHAVFRFPEHVLQASHRLVKATKDMGLKWDVVVELADYDVITVAQKELRDQVRIVAGIKSESLFKEAVRVRTMSQSCATTQFESWMSPSSATATGLGGEDDQLMDEAGQEQIVETLSKFLMPREVEVLSLRYGLVSTEEEDAEEYSSVEQPFFRNYQAEAEDELFGPSGMLSHYIDGPEKSAVAVTTVTEKAKRKSSTAKAAGAVASSTRKSQKKAAPHTLLPFKEVGKRMKFSGEYCRRTCTEALNKLTMAVEEGRLAESDFLLGW